MYRVCNDEKIWLPYPRIETSRGPSVNRKVNPGPVTSNIKHFFLSLKRNFKMILLGYHQLVRSSNTLNTLVLLKVKSNFQVELRSS